MSSQSSLADKRQRWSRFLAEEVNGKPFFKDQDVLWGIVEAACQLEHNNVPTWVFHAIDQRGIIEMLVNSSDTPDVAFRNRWQQVERAAARCRASGEGAGDVNPNYGAELAKWLRLHNRRSTEFIRLRHELQGIELFRQKNFADKQRILSNEGQRLTNTRRMIDRAPSVDHDTAIWSATESIQSVDMTTAEASRAKLESLLAAKQELYGESQGATRTGIRKAKGGRDFLDALERFAALSEIWLETSGGAATTSST